LENKQTMQSQRNLKPYSTTSCNVTVMHEENHSAFLECSRLGRNILNAKGKPEATVALTLT